jgi:hypothetical protein
MVGKGLEDFARRWNGRFRGWGVKGLWILMFDAVDELEWI